MPVSKGRCSKEDLQGNGNAVAIDDPIGNEIDEMLNLEADTIAGPKAEGHVIEGSENPETVGQLLENAVETGTNRGGVQRITRSGRQSPMRQHPDFVQL